MYSLIGSKIGMYMYLSRSISYIWGGSTLSMYSLHQAKQGQGLIDLECVSAWRGTYISVADRHTVECFLTSLLDLREHSDLGTGSTQL